MIRVICAAFVAAVTFGGAASAATLSGTFDVLVVNVTDMNSSDSKATLANISAAATNGFGPFAADQFTYTGALDFATNDQSDGTTILGWLNSKGSGTVAGLDASVGNLQLSKDNINNGTATTTFFLFALKSLLPAADFVVTHDDGFAIFDGDTRVGGLDGPTAVKTTNVFGFDGGEFSLLYVATNGDPSILHVDATVVPVPATLPLLLAGLGGIALMRRRKAA